MAYGQLPEVEWARRILGYRRPFSVPEDQCHSRILEAWRRLLDAARDDKGWQLSYVAGLNRALCAESGEISAIASELLGLQGWLDPEQTRITFRQLIQDIFDDYGLTARLSDWLSGSLSEEIRDSVADSVEKGLSSLDAQTWDSHQSDPQDTGPYLILPLLHWRITGQSDDRSKRVFLRGLKMALMPERQGPRRESRQRGIEDVVPLLNKVPASFRQEGIRYGASIEDPAVRGLCRLFVLESPGSAGSAT